MKFLKTYLSLMEANDSKSLVVIKIDSRKREVNLVKIDDWNYKKIYDLIGHGCRNFEVPFVFDNEDTLYTDGEFAIKEFSSEVDENGFYYPGDYGFILLPYYKKFVFLGNAVITGSNDEGETVSVKSTLELIRREIVFVNINREEGEYEYYEWDSLSNKYKKSEHND